MEKKVEIKKVKKNNQNTEIPNHIHMVTIKKIEKQNMC